MVAWRDEVAEVAWWADGIEEMHQCISGRFRRPEPRRRALAYLRGLLGPVECKNGWQLAEQAGDATPDGVQRLFYNYRRDADLVRDDLRDYVLECEYVVVQRFRPCLKSENVTMVNRRRSVIRPGLRPWIFLWR